MPQLRGDIRVRAFLDMLAVSEIGHPLLAASDDGYNVIVGSTVAAPDLLTSYDDHPRKLITLGALGIKSDAAGRYQFMSFTWAPLRMLLGLPDFSPVSQDLAARELLRRCGALAHILATSMLDSLEIATAITLAAPTWASLPGAGYGQHENRMLDLIREYGAALERNLP